MSYNSDSDNYYSGGKTTREGSEKWGAANAASGGPLIPQQPVESHEAFTDRSNSYHYHKQSS